MGAGKCTSTDTDTKYTHTYAIKKGSGDCLLFIRRGEKFYLA